MALCCSTKTFIVTVSLWFLVSLGALGFTMYAQFAGPGIFLVVPDVVYIVFTGLFALWTVVSFAGIMVKTCHSEVALIFFIVMNFLTVIITVAGVTFVLLYANDISTIESLDNAAGTAQSDASVSILEWATDYATEWAKIQEDLQCCGYNFETTTLEFEKYTVDYKTKTVVDTSTTFCTEIPTNISAVCALQEDCELVLALPSGFYCEDAFGVFLQEKTLFIAIGSSAIVLLLIVSWIAGIRLYWVPFMEGGFYDGSDSGYNDLPTKRVVDAGNTGDSTLPTAPSFNSSNQSTSKFGSSIRTFGNRVSMKLSGAPVGQSNFSSNAQLAPSFGASPSGGFGEANSMFGGMPPASSSFNPSGGGAGGPGGGFGGAVKNFGNRMSMKLMNKPVFNSPRGPLTPPPSFGGGMPSNMNTSFNNPPPMGAPSFSNAKNDAPAPNTFNAGAPAAAAYAGGFGGKVKNSFNRVSARMTGKNMFGGFAPRGPPPPGFGSAPQQSFGAPPASFGAKPSQPAFNQSPPAFNQSKPTFNQSKPKKNTPVAPKKGGGKKAGNARPANPMAGGGRGGLLAQINGGTRLNHTQTDDRSGPNL